MSGRSGCRHRGVSIGACTGAGRLVCGAAPFALGCTPDARRLTALAPLPTLHLLVSSWRWGHCCRGSSHLGLSSAHLTLSCRESLSCESASRSGTALVLEAEPVALALCLSSKVLGVHLSAPRSVTGLNESTTLSEQALRHLHLAEHCANAIRLVHIRDAQLAAVKPITRLSCDAVRISM